MERYYTVNEIAEMFKVTRTTVYEWMSSGRLGWVQVGGRRRVTQTAIDSFVRSGIPYLDNGRDSGVQSEDTLKPSLAAA